MVKRLSEYWGSFFQADEESRSGPSLFLALLVRTGTVLLLYVLVDRSLIHIARLPEASYERPFILLETLKVQLEGFRLLLLVPIFLLFWWKWRALWERWSAIDGGRNWRPFLVLAAALLAWSFSTYDYNLYFDQGHYFDRALLLVLVSLFWWRPLFVFPFLVVLLPIIGQFYYPLGGYSWTALLLPVRILMLFGATWLLRVLSGYWKVTDFAFLVCCLLASHYWPSALQKLRMGWLVQDHVYFLLPSTYANGWLSFLDPVRLSALTALLSLFNLPIKVLALLIEGGCLAFLWRRRFLLILLGSWVLFHLAIFSISGILFWRWIILAAALILLFVRNRRSPAFAIFSRPHLVLSLALILGSALWFRPIALAWYDTRASYTYRFEAEGASGRKYSLAPEFFAPYDVRFTLSGFRFLSREPRLGISWGAISSRSVAEALVQSRSPEEFFKVEADYGAELFDAEMRSTLDEFLRRFLNILASRDYKRAWFSPLAAPQHLWTFAREDAYRSQEPVVAVSVYEITSMYSDSQYSEIRKQMVHKTLLD